MKCKYAYVCNTPVRLPTYIYCDFDLYGFLCMTENIEHERFILHASYLNMVVEDWKSGTGSFCPENEAPVYFAMFNGHVQNTSEFRTFKELMEHLIKIYHIGKAV